MDLDSPETIPEALRELDLGTLVGLTGPMARDAVEAAGGVFRVERFSLSSEHNPRRVTVRLHNGLVTKVIGGLC